MGCGGSSHDKGEETTKKLQKPKAWKHTQPITRSQLKQMRDEFWDTAPHYGGQKAYIKQKAAVAVRQPYMRAVGLEETRDANSGDPAFMLEEIWDALHAAAEADLTLAQAIVDSAGVIVTSGDMTTCYDERGAKYELPKYVLSEPTNLIRDS